MTSKQSNGDSGGRYEVSVVAHALDLLTLMASQDDLAVSTAEASEHLQIARSTAYRLLLTLASRGFVDHDKGARGWTLGWGFYALAQKGQAEKLRQAAGASMRRILSRERETVNLAAFTGTELVYISSLDSPHPFRMTEAPGEVAHLHATALGKAVLASLPDAAAARLTSQLEFVPLTNRTVGLQSDLDRQLRLIRKRGWALEAGEVETGVSCIAAAILDGGQAPVAALSVSVPDVRLPRDRAARIGELLAIEAVSVSENLQAGDSGRVLAGGASDMA